MRYRDEWKGRLRVNSIGEATWDGRLRGLVRARSVDGARSPGGMVTNTVFDARRGYTGDLHAFASMTLALEWLLSEPRTLTPCPACGQPWDATIIPPPRVPLGTRCACCCQDGQGNPAWKAGDR